MKASRKDWIIIIAISIVIIQTIVFLGLMGFEQRRTTYPANMPKDFNFIASLWTDSYRINTYIDSLRKAITWENDTMIALHLTQEEKELIYKTITKIDIYKYPENYAPTSTISETPSFTFFIKMTMNNIDHSINWTENTESETSDAKRLRELFKLITEQIEKHKETKELPKSERYIY